MTSSIPWLKVNANYVNLNLQEAEANKTVVYIILESWLNCVKKILVLLNFTSNNATVNTSINLEEAKVLISNYSKPTLTNKILCPYVATLYEL